MKQSPSQVQGLPYVWEWLKIIASSTIPRQLECAKNHYRGFPYVTFLANIILERQEEAVPGQG